jgi:glycosyltransferase involved in cell wall biosynthesis
MLRILFVTGSLSHGGAERQSVAVMNRLAERGHECHAVYVKSDEDLVGRIRLRDGGTVASLDAVRYFDARSLADFAARIARIGPSAIVAANSYALMYASLALRIARRRSVLIVTCHSTRLPTVKEQLQMLAYRPLFWLADCTVFVCERQKRHWLRRGVLSRRNEVIYNGVDTDAFRARSSPEERRRVRDALGFGDADFVIGLSAVLRPEKNHVQLVDAVAALRGRGIPARALLIGDGEMRGAIQARARAQGVERDVVITGFTQDVRPYIEASDAMTLCSITEALSMAVIEAMALNKPVVHSDVGGAAEMIVPGENGFLFPVGDTPAYAAKLALLADGALARRMGTHARQAVLRRFSEQAMIERYEQLLLELCAASPAGAAVTQ